MSARFQILVPVQSPRQALPRSGLQREERARLATAFAADTLHAIRMCSAVANLVVVSPDLEVTALASQFDAEFVLSNGSLDEALNEAAEKRCNTDVQMIATVVADLPSLQRGEFERILSEVGRRRRSAYALDLKGTGVTFHADPVGAFDACLEDGPVARLAARDAEPVGQFVGGLRCDVDTCEGMRIAAYLGVGPRARSELDLLGDRIARVARVVAST